MAFPPYLELLAKADAFFARVELAHPAQMHCRSGCEDCCLTQLTVTQVEAAHVLAALEELSPEVRARLAARAEQPDPNRCSALEDDGRCAIYPFRPLVCRTHGLPLRLKTPEGSVVLQSCFRNFADASTPPREDCVLDQETLSTLLHAVDQAHAGENGMELEERAALSEVLARGRAT